MTVETKTDLRPATLEMLQDLTGTNTDSAEFFTEAASRIEDPRLAGLFRDLADQRRLFALRLGQLIAWNDEVPEMDESLRAKMRRWWLRFRGLLETGDSHTVLSEVEAAEDVIKQRYESLLTANPGSAASDVLHAQYAQVKAAHDRVRDLRDQLAPQTA